jgi:hypothetical protein
LAERLSHDYHLPYYKADDHMWRHLEQANPQKQPTMAAYSKMSWDQIWSQPVNKQVQDVSAYYTEQFPMILGDLLGYRDQDAVIMEGVAFLPALVYELGFRSDQVLFLVPTKAFQTAYYSQRSWVGPILEACADPHQAFANWMERDHRFGQQILQDAIACGYQTIIVNGGMDIDALYEDVKNHFKLS